MQLTKIKTAISSINSIYVLLLVLVIISGLYFGKAFLIPLALAILLTFLLAPLANYLQKIVGRIASVLLVVIFFFTLLGGISYFLTIELVDITSKLPNYKTNIEKKLHALVPKGGNFNRVLGTVEELQKEFSKPTQTSDQVIREKSATFPVVKIEEPTALWLNSAQWFLGGLANTLGSFGLVLLLVIFMLLNRDDLKSRVVRLIGKEHILTTTQAMDDASQRVSHYLLMQLVINLIFGLLISIGLYFIGVPNAALWGGLSVLLKFIPYIGPLITIFLESERFFLP